jgi:hypothetical protein
MSKHAAWAFLLLAGCWGESMGVPDEPQGEAGDEGTEVQIDPAKLANPTAELGTERTRPIAKSIEWLSIGSEPGDTYGGLVIDRVERGDGNGLYGVTVRLKNTTKDRQKVQWLIRFVNRQGGHVAAYAGSLGDKARWQGAVVEPFGFVSVSDFARTSGAEGFKLLVKGPGASGDGAADVKKPVED